MTRRTNTKIEIVRIVLDGLVLIVMVCALLLALKANSISNQTLRAQYVPWVEINDISTTFANDTLIIDYGLRNFSSAPALNIDVTCSIGNVASKPHTRGSDALLPQNSGKARFQIHGSPEVERMYHEVMAGTVPVKFTMSYEDMFRHHYHCITQTRRDAGVCSETTALKLTGLRTQPNEA